MFRNLLLYIFVLPANSIVTISKNDEYLCKFDRSAARTHIAFVFSLMHVRPTVSGADKIGYTIRNVEVALSSLFLFRYMLFKCYCTQVAMAELLTIILL